MSSQPETTTTSITKPTTISGAIEKDKGKQPENNTTSTLPNSNSMTATDRAAEEKSNLNSANQEKPKREKKPGFFARWKESTSKAYDAHRAAGGNL